jgi:uncharacterized protein YkwD
MMIRKSFAAAISSCVFLATPAVALDLNSFRAEHHRSALSYSAALAGIAYAHANDMASRNHLDHNGFREIANASGGASAQNVLWGCDDEDCAIRMWARSGGHRANMLRSDVSAYGIASATTSSGRRYWVLELGN